VALKIGGFWEGEAPPLRYKFSEKRGFPKKSPLFKKNFFPEPPRRGKWPKIPPQIGPGPISPPFGRFGKFPKNSRKTPWGGGKKFWGRLKISGHKSSLNPCPFRMELSF